MFADCINAAGHRGKCETVLVNSAYSEGNKRGTFPSLDIMRLIFKPAGPICVIYSLILYFLKILDEI